MPGKNLSQTEPPSIITITVIAYICVCRNQKRLKITSEECHLEYTVLGKQSKEIPIPANQYFISLGTFTGVGRYDWRNLPMIPNKLMPRMSSCSYPSSCNLEATVKKYPDHRQVWQSLPFLCRQVPSIVFSGCRRHLSLWYRGKK